MNKIALGKCIKEAREKAEITQQKLADDLGVSVHTISNIERGISYPGMDLLFKIDDILDHPMESFFASLKKHSDYINIEQVYKNADKLTKEDRTIVDTIYQYIVDSFINKYDSQ